MTPRWRWQPPSLRTTLNVLITVVGVMAVAVVGLLVEDILPKGGDEWTTGWRLGGALLTMASLVGLVWWRSRLLKRQGTLYYVTFPMRTLPETHLSKIDEIAEKHDRSVALKRWVAGFAPRPEPQVVDVADDVASLARDLQQAINSDNASTGFTLAPDLLWPMAVSLGYDLYPRRGTTLLEIHGAASGPQHGDAWSWTTVTGLPVLGAEPLLSAAPVTIWTGVGSGVTQVVADLSDRTVTSVEAWPFRQDRRYRVAVFRETTADTDDPSGIDGPRQAISLRVCTTSRGTMSLPEVDIVAQLTATIRHAVHFSNDQPVFLGVRMPKTIAVALGHSLRANACPEGAPCIRAACRNLWSVLVPLHFDAFTAFAAQPYTAMRVHTDQPGLGELQDRVNAARKPRRCTSST